MPRLDCDAGVLPGDTLIGHTNVTGAGAPNESARGQHGIAPAPHFQPGSRRAGVRSLGDPIRLRHGLVCQLHVPQPQPVAVHQHSAGYSPPVDEDAVGAAEVLHRARPVRLLDARMAA